MSEIVKSILTVYSEGEDPKPFKGFKSHPPFSQNFEHPFLNQGCQTRLAQEPHGGKSITKRAGLVKLWYVT